MGTRSLRWGSGFSQLYAAPSRVAAAAKVLRRWSKLSRRYMPIKLHLVVVVLVVDPAVPASSGADADAGGNRQPLWMASTANLRSSQGWSVSRVSASTSNSSSSCSASELRGASVTNNNNNNNGSTENNNEKQSQQRDERRGGDGGIYYAPMMIHFNYNTGSEKKATMKREGHWFLLDP